MLKDNVVVVTGGAGLIGQEFTKTIVKQNGIAIIADINKELGKKVKNRLNKQLKTNIPTLKSSLALQLRYITTFNI